MKKIKIVLVTILSLFLATSVVGANGGEEHRSLEAIEEELINKYQVDSKEQLDCQTLSQQELIELGDGVMESNHPGEAHERMDEMMGGEGSQTLDEMHLQMGRGYLGCSTGNTTMMGNDRSSTRMMGPGGMMGQNWMTGGWFGLLRGTVLVLTGGVLIAAIRYLWRKG